VTHTLFIQLPSAMQTNEPVTVDWALFDAEQKVAGASSCSLADTVAQTADFPDKLIVALVPGADILQTQLTIPVGQKRHLQRTLPFLVEEEIATPIEEMHLCAGPVQGDQARVLVTSHSAMQTWLQQLKAHQIEADWLLPDSTALAADSELEILLDSQGAHFYCPQQPVINTEFINLTFIADTLIEQFPEDQKPSSGSLLVSKQLSETEQAAAAALATQFEVSGISLQQQTIESRFDFCCSQLLPRLQQDKSDTLINLLNGDYRSTSKRQNSSTPKWGMLTAAVVLCILIKLLLDLGAGLYLNHQSDKLDEQINALYHDLFPQDKRIINAKVQMQNHLNGQASNVGGSSFMPLFSYVAEALNNQEDIKNTQLQQLRYNDKNQTLMVDINVKDVQQLEQLKHMIEARNIKVTILSANEERQWIKGRIRLAL
jgi:general secretion pathway protein L